MHAWFEKAYRPAIRESRLRRELSVVHPGDILTRRVVHVAHTLVHVVAVKLGDTFAGAYVQPRAPQSRRTDRT